MELNQLFNALIKTTDFESLDFQEVVWSQDQTHRLVSLISKNTPEVALNISSFWCGCVEGNANAHLEFEGRFDTGLKLRSKLQANIWNLVLTCLSNASHWGTCWMNHA